MLTLIINLRNAKERRRFQEEQFKALGLEFEILNATSVSQIEKNIYQKHYNDWQRPLRKTEVACYYSHRSAWSAVLKSGEPTLILEDDALLSQTIPEIMANLIDRADTDLINLEVRGRKKYVAKKHESIGLNSKLYRLHRDRCGAAGYILWPSGARKLLESERHKGIALADAHIFDCDELVAYQIEPAAVIQLDMCSFYDISISGTDKVSATSISTSAAPRGGLRFRAKRIMAQLKLGARQLLMIGKAQKRYIKLRKEDFSNE